MFKLELFYDCVIWASRPEIKLADRGWVRLEERDNSSMQRKSYFIAQWWQSCDLANQGWRCKPGVECTGNDKENNIERRK